MSRPLHQIETWIFDLDNTLYPSSCALYRQVEARMTEFIMTELSLDAEAAQALRRRFFEQHGTTLRGLMLEYAMEPARFLDYVHELDLSPVPSNPELVAALAALPGRKLVFTNGTARHAERLLAHLDLTSSFSGIHDIVTCEYRAKPDPSGYHRMIARHAIDAGTTAMVEDMARNLAPAAALGMTTIWIKGGPHCAPEDADAAHIHHVIEEAGALAPFLVAAPLTPAAE